MRSLGREYCYLFFFLFFSFYQFYSGSLAVYHKQGFFITL